MVKLVILGPYQKDHSKSLGGAHTHTYDLVNYLKNKSSFDIHVVTISKMHSHDEIINEGNVTIHYLSSSRLPLFLSSLTINQYKLYKKLRYLRPDLVHAQGTAPTYGFSTSLYSTNYVLTVHGIVKQESKTWYGLAGFVKGLFYKKMELTALKRAKSIIAVTPYVKETITPLCNSPIDVIPVGISNIYFDIPRNEKNNRLLFVGGIEPRKGLLSLLEAIRILSLKGQQVDLHIVGRIRKRRYFSQLKKYIEENNLRDNVCFRGFLEHNELLEEYSECSVFVLPSREESEGIVLLEAMAAGVPVVATKIGGVPYIVDDSKNGYLSNYGDSEELAHYISILLNDDTQRREFGKAGKSKAEKFTTDYVGRLTYDFYLNSIKNGLLNSR